MERSWLGMGAGDVGDGIPPSPSARADTGLEWNPGGLVDDEAARPGETEAEAETAPGADDPGGAQAPARIATALSASSRAG
jgi:hypothetical protein